MNALTTLPLATLVAFALNLIFSVTVICLITLLAARLLFRHNPAMRYALCLAGVMSALLVPLAVGFMAEAGCGLTVLSLPEYFSAPRAAAPVSARFAGDAGTTAPVRETPVLRPEVAVGIEAAALIWAAGVVWGILRFLRGCKIASRFTDGIQSLDASSRREMQEAAERLMGGALPPIFTSPRVASPIVVGLFRPLIILPEGLAETLSPVQFRQILLHEYAHIAFRHTLGGVAERFARLLYWPHPLAHVLCRELARAREEVCDNVASREAGAACYARTLLALAQGMTTAPNLTSALALLGPDTSMEKRIAGLLHPRRNRMTEVKRKQLWAVAGAAALAIGMTTTIRLVSAADKAQSEVLASFDKPDRFWLRVGAEAKAKKAKESAGESEARERRANPKPEERIQVHLVSGNQANVWRNGQKLGTIQMEMKPSPHPESQPRPAPEPKVVHVKFQVESKGNSEPMMAQSIVQLDEEVARWKAASKVQFDKVQLDEEVARWKVTSKAQEAKIKAEAKAQEAQAAKQEAEAQAQKAQAAKQEAEANAQEAERAKREDERTKAAN